MGVRGRAMGSAMVSAANDWSAVHYNPAALVRVVHPVAGGEYEFFYGVTRSTESLRNLGVGQGDPRRLDLTDPFGDEPRTLNEKSVDGTVQSGTMGYAGVWGDVAFGVGLYGAGAGSSWKDTVSTSSGDRMNAEIAFRNVAVILPLAAAYRVTDEFAVGVGVGVRYGLLDVKNSKTRSGALPYTMSYEQDTAGTALSADLGLLWRANPRLGIGAVAKLPYRIGKSGEARLDQSLAGLQTRTDTAIDEDYPARLSFGFDLRPGLKHLIALSATWLDWSSYRQTVDYEIEIPGMLQDTSGNPSDWQDTWIANMGYEYALSEIWDLRCGVLYDQAPEPREAKTLAGGQVVDIWKFSAGAGWQWRHAQLNFGYSYTHGPATEGYVPGAEYTIDYHELYVGLDWAL